MEIMMRVLSTEEFYELKQDKGDFLLLDVRDAREHQICNLGGKLIPMNEVPDRIEELDKTQHIIVYCKSGGRSQLVGEFLETQGFKNVSNLAGGIMAWIDKYDPSMKKY
jgi:rhodanese-related sulfurtransferase